MTTLNDVRAALIAQGYPADQVDAMLNLAGRMVLEGSLASKGDLNQLRDEFTQFKIDVVERFAELRIEMNERFAEQRADADARERRIIKWAAGAVIGGIAVNIAVLGIGIAIVALLVR